MGSALLLPEELLERILLHLPLPDLSRSRSVCKRWHALTSTPQFANARRSISDQTQLLLLCSSASPQLACFAYDFQSCAWYKLPLHFLLEGYSTLPSGGAHASFKGSVGGLLVVDILNRRGGGVSTYLCDPFTRSCSTVPRSPTVYFTLARGFVVDDVANSFKVVVVGSSREGCPYRYKYRSNDLVTKDSPMTEVFDSSGNSWTTTERLPPGYHVCDEFMTLRDGFFYCTESHSIAVMIYNLQQGNWTQLEMPRQDENQRCWYTMMNCNGRLLISAAKMSDIGAAEYIIMWELDLERKMWEELGKMPREHFELIIDREINCFECFAVGNRICFRSLRNLNILMYQLCEKSWSWLPICPFAGEMNGDGYLPVKGFGLQPQISGDLLSTYTEASRKFPRPLLIQSPSSTTAGFLPS